MCVCIPVYVCVHLSIDVCVHFCMCTYTHVYVIYLLCFHTQNNFFFIVKLISFTAHSIELELGLVAGIAPFPYQDINSDNHLVCCSVPSSGFCLCMFMCLSPLCVAATLSLSLLCVAATLQGTLAEWRKPILWVSMLFFNTDHFSFTCSS